MGSLDEFILELATVEAIKFGSFTLKSGQVGFFLGFIPYAF